MTRRLLLLLAALLLGSGVGAPASAHGGSYDMKYVDGSNVLLLTFNTHAPVSGLDIEHNLRLYDLVGAPVIYDEVAVEVHTLEKGQTMTLRGGTSLLEDTLPMLATNESKLSFAYPVQGSYAVRVRFASAGQTVSSGEFVFDVGPGTAASGGTPWLRLGLALMVGLTIGALLPRADRTRRDPTPPEGHPRRGEPQTRTLSSASVGTSSA